MDQRQLGGKKAGERRRRYYRVTVEGRRVLDRQRKTWAAFVDAVRRVTGGEHARPCDKLRVTSSGVERSLERRVARVCAWELCRHAKRNIVEELSQHLDDRRQELIASLVPHRRMPLG